MYGNYDISNITNNQLPYNGTNSYTRNGSARVNVGTTAFYNKNKE